MISDGKSRNKRIGAVAINSSALPEGRKDRLTDTVLPPFDDPLL